MINEQHAHLYCKEDISKIENYDKALADTTQTWEVHHRTEIWWNCTTKELIANECYYHRKACELIFLTKAEHARLHNKGKILSAETRQKLSEVNKGENSRMYGKTLSAETRKKMSDSKKGLPRSVETRKKISKSRKGMTFTPEHRQKLSEARKAYWERRRQGGTAV